MTRFVQRALIPLLLIVLFHGNCIGISAFAQTDLRVVGLGCEGRDDPTGVDTAQPRLSWQVAGTARGQKQTAYRILVGPSRESLAQGRNLLWDSGRVSSSSTLRIPYRGSSLASSQSVFWTVRAWDKDKRPTAPSAVASWTMGLLKPEEWKGVWIVAPGATESLLLRRDFMVRSGLRRAVAHVCGLGQYEMTLNGAKVGSEVLSPGWTAYDRTTLYDTYDITGQLREGPNAVGMFLANGMYNVVRRNRFAKFTGSFGPLRAIVHLRLEYADGMTEFVGSDPTWRCLAGPLTFSDMYGGEDYDARLFPVGWDTPGFSDTSWQKAVALIRPAGTLQGLSASAQPLRVIEIRTPVGVRDFPDGTRVYDLGQNASYMPLVRISGPVGSVVRLTPAEIVRADWTITTSTMGGADRGSRSWSYTKATEGEETFAPRFCYVGCRYLKAELLPPEKGAPPKIVALQGRIVHSSAEPLGQFAASNDLLNRIRGLVRWAQRSNLVSVLTDCPHREKLGWVEQYHLNGPSLRYEFDVASLFAKGMHDMADAQTDTGLIPNIAPEYTKFKNTFRAAAEWGAAFFLVPWQQYEFTGDTSLLEKYYEPMQRYFAYLESRAEKDILTEGLGDWYDLGPKKPGAAQLTPPPVTATAFFFDDAQTLARIARVLHRPDDEAKYTARAAQIRAAYNQRFLVGNGVAKGSQTASALPLVMGIVEPQDRAKVETALVKDIEARDYAITAGDVGFRYLLLSLAQANRSDIIYRMINQTDKPGYGYQVKKGETTLCESWDANDTSSHNHFMLGQIVEWFYADLAGIAPDPAGPGFEKILIRPTPVGDLASVRATYDSVRGPITSAWRRDSSGFHLAVHVPSNTSATVSVPALPGMSVREGGKPAAQQKGLRFLRQDGDRAVFSAESGSYLFHSPWRGRP